MIFYKKFGYEVKLLEKEHSAEIFRLLVHRLRNSKRRPEMHSKDRYKIKKEIEFALTEKNYNSVGIFKDDILIGISFSSIIKSEQTPWLGYFYINPKNRKSKAGIVLGNYLINHLYKDYLIQLGPGKAEKYENFVNFSPMLGIATIKKEISSRLLKLCNEDRK